MYKKQGELENRIFSEAVSFVRETHAKRSGVVIGAEDVLDIPVSYDGTWLTRGHTSHVGVGCVVDLLTGLCIDFHVMSTYCHVCETKGTPLKDKPDEYEAWYNEHKKTCDKNFNGTSGMMEVEAARVLWGRSVERYKLRYKIMICDGDSKTFNELTRIKPYGEDVEIEKEECLNHVAKRLGTALRNVVADCRKKGVTLGGHGRGRLTQNTIRKLTIYYRRAIRGATGVDAMKRAVNATLHHCYSTDSYPRHELCPAGENSWCFYQAAVAKHEFPQPHKELIKTPLDFTLLDPYIRPIYD